MTSTGPSAPAGSRLEHLLTLFAWAWRAGGDPPSRYERRAGGAVIRSETAAEAHVIAWNAAGWAAATVAPEPSSDPQVQRYFASCGPAVDPLRSELRPDEHVVAILWSDGQRGGGVGPKPKVHWGPATRVVLEKLRRRGPPRRVSDGQAEVALELAPMEPAPGFTLTAEQGAHIVAPPSMRARRMSKGRAEWLAGHLAAMGFGWDWREALDAAQQTEVQHVRRERSIDGELLVACYAGDRAGVEATLDEGADIETRASRNRGDWFAGDTPLVIAIGRNDAVVSTLLKRGANPNQKGGFDYPLGRALEGQQEQLVPVLLAAGADVTLEFEPGSMLELAARKGLLAALRALIDAGAVMPAHPVRRERIVAWVRDRGDEELAAKLKERA